MSHSISVKVIASSPDRATIEISGAFAPLCNKQGTQLGDGFPALAVEVIPSLGYLLDYGRKQCVRDAGALPKGTPPADVLAAMRERAAQLVAGYAGQSGGARLPVWVRLAAQRLRPICGEDVKPGDLHQGLMREDAGFWKGVARARKLNPAKLQARVLADVVWAKAEAARRADAEALETVDLDDLR